MAFSVTLSEGLHSADGCKPFHFLQTPFWAAFKEQHHWKYQFFSFEAASGDTVYHGTASVLTRNLFHNLGAIAYIPLGIEVSGANEDFYRSETYAALLSDFAAALKARLQENVFCLRIDPPIEFLTLEEKSAFIKQFVKTNRIFKKSPVDIQPPDTVLLDLKRDEEEILSAMKPKWRYNIRLAEKKGVTVTANDASKMDVFYKIFEETAERDGIAVHSKDYYKSLLNMSSEENKVTLYIAEHEGEPLAGIITLFTGTEAVYLYGASSNNKRNLMPAYLLQWTAIKDAKAFGSVYYDFYGIPPETDEHHPMYGLYRFKTGFGGTVIHRAGSFDVPVKPLMYNLYLFMEKLRAFYFKKVKKIFISKKK